MRRAFVRRLRHWIANRGVIGFAATVMQHVRKKLRRRTKPSSSTTQVESAGPPLEVHPFDARHGVETGGLIWGEELRSGHEAEYWATAYYGISPSSMWQALDLLALDWDRFTFVDIGCGKGRGLMLALKYPFKAVLGVELSPELAAAAKRNLQRFKADWRTDAAADAVAGDATRTELPSGPLVLFLYHPFAAPVMRRFVENLGRSLAREPREIYVLYANPEVEGALLKAGFMTRLWREYFTLTDEDVRGDRFGARGEVVAAYRSV